MSAPTTTAAPTAADCRAEAARLFEEWLDTGNPDTIREVWALEERARELEGKP